MRALTRTNAAVASRAETIRAALVQEPNHIL
jgi:hypothetical protein